MADTIRIPATTRSDFGKGYARRIRQAAAPTSAASSATNSATCHSQPSPHPCVTAPASSARRLIICPPGFAFECLERGLRRS